jgi:hypothetical protein
MSLLYKVYFISVSSFKAIRMIVNRIVITTGTDNDTKHQYFSTFLFGFLFQFVSQLSVRVEIIDFHKHNSKKRAADTNQARGPGFDVPSRRLYGVWRLEISLLGVSGEDSDFILM